MAAIPGPTPKGIRAYHGSPHSFDKFDMSKIGTGEGAQAYGHGLYFAENEGVAKSYRDALTNFRPDNIEAMLVNSGLSPSLANTYARFAAETKGGPRSFDEFAAIMNRPGPAPNIESFRAGIRDELPKLKSALENISGSMYEVQINADPDQFLDWDKPLSEQPEGARKVLEKLGWYGNDAMPQGYYNQDAADIIGKNRAGGQPSSGADVYAAMTEKGQAHGSEQLKQAGIPGIKYLDQGSRAKGDGSRNYVVFDDSLVQILRKYGLLPAMLGGGAMFGSLAPQDTQQQ